MMARHSIFADRVLLRSSARGRKRVLTEWNESARG
jgi:hypothetical protein